MGGVTAPAASQFEACPRCGLVQVVPPVPPGRSAICPRCGAAVERHLKASLDRTAALALSALILFLPANLMPLITIQRFGVRSEATAWQGVTELWRTGSWGVAALVFMASLAVPLTKLLGLFWLCAAAGRPDGARERARLHRVLESIGPWAMLDVFLLAVLVAVVKLGDLATVEPGPGIVAYAGMVVCSVLASASFDPRLVWARPRETLA